MQGDTREVERLRKDLSILKEELRNYKMALELKDQVCPYCNICTYMHTPSHNVMHVCMYVVHFVPSMLNFIFSITCVVFLYNMQLYLFRFVYTFRMYVCCSSIL